MSNVFFYEPFYDFDRLLDEAFWRHPNASNNQSGQVQRRSDNVDGAVRAFKPRMDLHEDAEKNLVTATFELPGVNKQDVQINLTQAGRLTVGAELKSEGSRSQDGYAVRERRYGRFARTLNIPEGIKEEDIKASMENGVLTVTFPKASPEQAPRKISVA